MANLPKLLPRTHYQLIQEVTEEPRTTTKELQASLASVHNSAVKRQLGKDGRGSRRKPPLIEKNTGGLDVIQIFCGLIKAKWNFLKGLIYS